MSPAVIAIGVTAAVVLIGVAVALLRDAGARSGLRVPVPWVAAGVVLLLIGVVLAPRLFGFTFLFLPLFLSRRLRRPPGPRSTGPGRWDASDEDRS